jgi:hypothetical protein
MLTLDLNHEGGELDSELGQPRDFCNESCHLLSRDGKCRLGHVKLAGRDLGGAEKNTGTNI